MPYNVATVRPQLGCNFSLSTNADSEEISIVEKIRKVFSSEAPPISEPKYEDQDKENIDGEELRRRYQELLPRVTGQYQEVCSVANDSISFE